MDAPWKMKSVSYASQDAVREDVRFSVDESDRPRYIKYILVFSSS